MKPAEFKKLAESIWGKNWRRPLGREVNRTSKMMRHYERGDTPVPEPIAEKLIQLAALSPSGETVKKVLKKRLPKVRALLAHEIAREAGKLIDKDK